jgi:hypothetical protein
MTTKYRPAQFGVAGAAEYNDGILLGDAAMKYMLPPVGLLLVIVGCTVSQLALGQPRMANPATRPERAPIREGEIVPNVDRARRTMTRPPTPNVPLVSPFREPTERETAAAALGRIGRPAVPSLVQALAHRDAEVREQAALVLARIGPDAEEAVPQLTALLDDQSEDVRKAAARALGQIGPAAADAVPALMRTLMQPEPTPPAR